VALTGVDIGTTVYGSAVSGGGAQVVSGGGAASHTAVSGTGSLFVSSGGTAYGTTVAGHTFVPGGANGGAETVSSLDISAVINSGGTQPVFGSASGAIVQSSRVEINLLGRSGEWEVPVTRNAEIDPPPRLR
jgi:autotransporter passenger strand-loop-strand repeat protein